MERRPANRKRIVADDYVLHVTSADGSDLSNYAGPKGLAFWIGGLHTLFVPLRFEVQVPPLFGEEMIAVRWLEGKIIEYWLSSDMLDNDGAIGILGPRMSQVAESHSHH